MATALGSRIRRLERRGGRDKRRLVVTFNGEPVAGTSPARPGEDTWTLNLRRMSDADVAAKFAAKGKVADDERS